jgi:hypothetical protein
MAKWKELPPSPEAIVKAALERAAEHHDRHAKGYARTFQQVGKAAHQEHARRIRSLADNPAEVAAIISAASQLNKAGGGNKERKGEALTSEARSDEEDRG